MSSARHHLPAGFLSEHDLQWQIEADIANSRKAQIEMEQNGQPGLAAMMRDAVDEHLEELNDARNGTWKPRHA